MIATRRRPAAPDDPAAYYDGVREAVLQDRLRNLCRLLALPHYHTHDSRRSEGGFPDSVIVRDPAGWARPWLLLVELKSEKGKPSPGQSMWGGVLRAAEEASGGALAYRLVRPSTWDRLTELLTAGRRED